MRAPWSPALLKPVTERLFRSLPCGGPPPADSAAAPGLRWVTGRAGRQSESTEVAYHLKIDVARAIVTEARVQAFGCPHTLAAACLLAERLRDRPLVDLALGAPQTWADELGVPVEKLGRLLIVEDALEQGRLNGLELCRAQSLLRT